MSSRHGHLSERSTNRLVLGATALVVFVLNLCGIWVPHPWRDEAATWISTQRSLPQLFSMLQSVDGVHGFYYLLVRLWGHVFGYNAVSLRAFSALGVAACAALVMALAQRMFSQQAAVYAGLICGLVPSLTWAATEARSAAWTAASASAIVLAFWVAAERGRWWRWALYAGLIALGITLFLYVALIPVVLLSAVPWITSVARRPMLLATIVGGLVAFPVGWLTTHQTAQVSWLAKYQATVLDVAVGALWGNVLLAQIVGTGGLLAAAVAAVLLWRRGVLRLQIVVLFAWLALPTVLLLAAGPLKPLYVSRYVVFSSPAAALLLSMAISQLRPKWLKLVALALFVAAMIPSWSAVRQADAKASPAEAIAKLDQLSRPGDAVYIVGKDVGGLRWAFPDTLGRLRIVGQATSGWREKSLYQPSVRPIGISGKSLAGVQRLWVFADRGAIRTELSDFERRGFSEVSRIQSQDSYHSLLVLLVRP